MSFTHVLRPVPLPTASFQWSWRISPSFLGPLSAWTACPELQPALFKPCWVFFVCLMPMPLSSRSSPVYFPVGKLTLLFVVFCLHVCLAPSKPSPVGLNKKRGAELKGSPCLGSPGVILITHRSLLRLSCRFSS